MGTFYKKSWNSEILVISSASPALLPCFLWPWAENQNSAPNIFFASSSCFRKPWEETDLAEKSVFGLRAWPQGLRFGWVWLGQNHLSKNYLRGVRLTLKILPQSDHGVKSHCSGHRQTDRLTDRQTFWITPKEIFFHILFYAWGGWETSNPAKFLPFHFVKLASLTSLIKDKSWEFGVNV